MSCEKCSCPKCKPPPRESAVEQLEVHQIVPLHIGDICMLITSVGRATDEIHGKVFLNNKEAIAFMEGMRSK
jgi:hypothetical protein